MADCIASPTVAEEWRSGGADVMQCEEEEDKAKYHPSSPNHFVVKYSNTIGGELLRRLYPNASEVAWSPIVPRIVMRVHGVGFSSDAMRTLTWNVCSDFAHCLRTMTRPRGVLVMEVQLVEVRPSNTKCDELLKYGKLMGDVMHTLRDMGYGHHFHQTEDIAHNSTRMWFVDETHVTMGVMFSRKSVRTLHRLYLRMGKLSRPCDCDTKPIFGRIPSCWFSGSVVFSHATMSHERALDYLLDLNRKGCPKFFSDVELDRVCAPSVDLPSDEHGTVRPDPSMHCIDLVVMRKPLLFKVTLHFEVERRTVGRVKEEEEKPEDAGAVYEVDAFVYAWTIAMAIDAAWEALGELFKCSMPRVKLRSEFAGGSCWPEASGRTADVDVVEISNSVIVTTDGSVVQYTGTKP